MKVTITSEDLKRYINSLPSKTNLTLFLTAAGALIEGYEEEIGRLREKLEEHQRGERSAVRDLRSVVRERDALKEKLEAQSDYDDQIRWAMKCLDNLHTEAVRFNRKRDEAQYLDRLQELGKVKELLRQYHGFVHKNWAVDLDDLDLRTRASLYPEGDNDGE